MTLPPNIERRFFADAQATAHRLAALIPRVTGRTPRCTEGVRSDLLTPVGTAGCFSFRWWPACPFHVRRRAKTGRSQVARAFLPDVHASLSSGLGFDGQRVLAAIVSEGHRHDLFVRCVEPPSRKIGAIQGDGISR